MIDLITTTAFLTASPELLAEVTNGCGPGTWKYNFIPKHLRDVYKQACDRHDWAYYLGLVGGNRLQADQILHTNMVICAHNHAKSPLELIALLRAAEVMYAAVRAGGAEHFGDNA